MTITVITSTTDYWLGWMGFFCVIICSQKYGHLEGNKTVTRSLSCIVWVHKQRLLLQGLYVNILIFEVILPKCSFTRQWFSQFQKKKCYELKLKKLGNVTRFNSILSKPPVVTKLSKWQSFVFSDMLGLFPLIGFHYHWFKLEPCSCRITK